MPVRILKAVALIIVLIAALGGGYLLGTHRPAGHDHALDQQVAKGQAATEKKQQYTCSMHPFIIRDEPGLCPICGMTLVPLKPGATGSQPQAAAHAGGRRPQKMAFADGSDLYSRCPRQRLYGA